MPVIYPKELDVSDTALRTQVAQMEDGLQLTVTVPVKVPSDSRSAVSIELTAIACALLSFFPLTSVYAKKSGSVSFSGDYFCGDAAGGANGSGFHAAVAGWY